MRDSDTVGRALRSSVHIMDAAITVHETSLNHCICEGTKVMGD